jgi:Tol biopolymer transport system component
MVQSHFRVFGLVYLTILLLPILGVALVVGSCALVSPSQLGRWDRYQLGGSFIGCSPMMSPDSAFIVYSSPSTGRGDIYRVNSDGSSVQQLTDDTNYEGDPSVSPDGKTIVFVREEDGYGHLWLMNADGSNQRRITDGREYDEGPSFSPDGLKIVFTRRVSDWQFTPGTSANAEVHMVKVDGTGLLRLTRNTKADWEASFGPDGRHILYSVRSREIWRMGQDGANPIMLGDGSSPAYSPDGKDIVFLSGEYGRAISIMSADGTNARVVHQSPAYKSRPTFCLGGTHIMFLEEAKANGTGTIVIMKTDGSERREICKTD